MKKPIFITALAGALCLSLSACGLLPEEEGFHITPTIADAVEAEYLTAQCTRGDIKKEVNVNVKYVPVRTSDLNFDTNGLYYDTIFVSVGEAVTEGELLAQLDLEDLDVKIDALKDDISNSGYSLSKVEENRQMALTKQRYQGNFMDPADLADAIAEINRRYDKEKQNIEDSLHFMNLRLEEYEGKVRERQLFAPFDGIVTYTYSFEPGEQSSKYKKIVCVADSSMSLFKGSTNYWDSFSEDELYTVVSDSISYDAHVVDPVELGIQTEERVPGKSEDVCLVLTETSFNLEDGDKGTVTLLLAHSENTLLVPTSAVSSINGKDVVYQLNDEGVRTFKYVTTGVRAEKYVEILEGLDEGDEVILN